LDPHRGTPAYHQAIHRINSAVGKVFRRQKQRAITAVGRLTKSRVFKAEDDSSEFDPGALADAIISDVFEEYRSLPSEIRPALEDAILSGINTGMLQLELHDTRMIAAANKLAEEFARSRAAELVGMRYNAEGELVENPNAEWAISDTTRDKIRRIVTEAFEGETKISVVADKIQTALEEDQAGIFTESRAMMIANTEVANAQVRGNYQVWEKSGLVEKLTWTVSADEPCDECEDNENVEVEFGTPFPSGDLYPPAHPSCRCVVFASEIAD
jgi:uncharacterized protein with gpF-like domain